MKTRIPSLTLHRVMTVALLGGIALSPVAAARADNLDEELIRKGPQIMKYLRDHGYQNVGVHAFTFQRGAAQPTFTAGLINQNIAERVERALVYALNPEDKPIGIINNASAVASKSLKGASYRTAEDRARLFTPQYPLAWGVPPKLVTADAFLMGKVTLSADLRTTKVLVAAFNRKDPASTDKVSEFEVKSDRFMLADAGQGFSLSKGKRTFRRGGVSDDEIFTAVSDDQKKVTEDGKQGRAPKPTRDPAATSDFPVELKINYDGAPQEMQPDAEATGPQNWAITDPREGQKVTFTMRNKTDSVLGVVLAVNGISTLYQETGQPDQMLRWVLEPNKEYSVKGYYQKGKGTYIEIEGISEELTQQIVADPRLPKAGFIHLFVFRISNQSGTAATAPGFSRSLRRLSTPAVKAKGPPKTAAELQGQIASGAGVRGGRGLMAWGANKKPEELEAKTLGTAVMTDALIVRYYKKP